MSAEDIPVPRMRTDRRTIEALADRGRVWYCVDMGGRDKVADYQKAVWGQDLAQDMIEVLALNDLLISRLANLTGAKVVAHSADQPTESKP